ncbi:MAG: type I DNA topoisomerase [Simkaniaceae bacterium]|nr:type I DNA topoisomerase [Simkaniaceae bacterium]
MSKSQTLIIVESPAKVKTLKRFLGKEFVIESSVGHIRDLPQKGFGIDVENHFEPNYENLPDKKEVISKLNKAALSCKQIYLSPDPDREGEAIAWHIAAILPKGASVKRITFNAITKHAVTEALKHPREIDQCLVDAQQARRLLDRIVGYKISPLLHRRIKRGDKTGSLSAGRVQSVALKLVVDREKAIETFVSVEYWNIVALLRTKEREKPFSASLYSVKGNKVAKEAVPNKKVHLIPDEKEATRIVALLKKSTYTVETVDRKEKKRYPVPPFITSTLQQEASRHHLFSAQRTMQVAQSLYEEGIITYIRTDSVRVAKEAIESARTRIVSSYGKEFLPEKPLVYKGKKSAQDAHEAIRPVTVGHMPEKLRSSLSADQYKLYLLIWQRFIASQMRPAIYDTVSCHIRTDKEMTLHAVGSFIKFRGFLAAYREKEDKLSDEEKEVKEEEVLLPDLHPGMSLDPVEITSHQAFTKPPPRFTEASLVKELEKSGIGRPSTYASIMNKIQSRSYTTKERLTLKPTELGRIIATMLEAHFGMIMDVGFTAGMEDELDAIAENKEEWRTFLSRFWKRFIPLMEKAEKDAFVPREQTTIPCPKCGKMLEKIWARGKYFYGCSDYPDCTFTVPLEALEFDKGDYADDFDWEQKCPKCSSPMTIRFGRFGAFLGCSAYPECKGIVSIPKKGETIPDKLPPCPAIGCTGRIMARKSRFGKTFFSCSEYPDCDVIANSVEELATKYPDHPKTPYQKKKTTKGRGRAGGASGKRPLSEDLIAIVGEKELTRGGVMKKVWEYIKEHDLQNPEDKRQILPDAKLKKVCGGADEVGMFQLAGLLSKHIE